MSINRVEKLCVLQRLPAGGRSGSGASRPATLGRAVGIAMAATLMLGAGGTLAPVSAGGIERYSLRDAPASRSESRTTATSRGWVNPLAAPDESMIGTALRGPAEQSGARTSDGTVTGTDARAFGSFGIPYTSTRVQLGRGRNLHDTKQLVASYPYRTAGKLFFTVPGWGRTHCSASVIERGIIVTAAHCVAGFGAGSGNFYEDFFFVPSFQRIGSGPIRPYSFWRADDIIVPTVWMEGTDPGCGAARSNDIAVLALQFRRDRAIGDVVGSMDYGWNDYSFVSSSRTGDLLTAAVTSLGYPGILDRGNAMQRVDGPTYPVDLCNDTVVNYWQGSNVGGGASGGPLVVNFGPRSARLSGGAQPGTDPVMAVVGVTSWGAVDPNAPKDNYATRFGQNSVFSGDDYGGYGAGNIGALINHVCTQVGSEYCW